MSVPTKALTYAKAQIGKPYLWGAEGPDSFDCSGLVHQAYLHAGLHLVDSTANGYMHMVRRVPKAALLPGMLVFPHAGHVQMYAGNGRIIEAPRKGLDVREVPMWGFLTGGYFPGTFTGRPYPGHLVKWGSSGADVRAIQTVVGVRRDGAFGPVTQHAVKAWQASHGYAVDGVVGPKTWAGMFRA